MKQLVLYFMFFVGSSLVFVECARLFPTTAETSARKPNHNTNKEEFIRFGASNRNMRNTLNAAVGLKGKISYHSVNEWVGSYIRKAKHYR